jgi:hypothetical protein
MLIGIYWYRAVIFVYDRVWDCILLRIIVILLKVA